MTHLPVYTQRFVLKLHRWFMVINSWLFYRKRVVENYHKFFIKEIKFIMIINEFRSDGVGGVCLPALDVESFLLTKIKLQILLEICYQAYWNPRVYYLSAFLLPDEFPFSRPEHASNFFMDCMRGMQNILYSGGFVHVWGKLPRHCCSTNTAALWNSWNLEQFPKFLRRIWSHCSKICSTQS